MKKFNKFRKRKQRPEEKEEYELDQSSYSRKKPRGTKNHKKNQNDRVKELTQDIVDTQSSLEQLEKDYSTRTKQKKQFDDFDPDKICLGIDLGTTNTCAYFIINGNLHLVTNEQGHPLTPSQFAINERGERLVGEVAKNQLTINPKGTVYSVKRIIGRKVGDADLKKDQTYWGFQIIADKDRPLISLPLPDGKSLNLSAEEISAYILMSVKQRLKQQLQWNNQIHGDVVKAVITVPAYFTDAQRQSTRRAGKIAGLDVIRIINEPTAASLAYAYERLVKNPSKESEMPYVALVVDLGGGTFDVSLVLISGPKVEVLGTSGNTHLGGDDVDSQAVSICLEDLRSRYSFAVASDLTPAGKKRLRKLRTACERAKIELSSEGVKTSTITIDSFLPNGDDYTIVLTRSQLEHKCTHFLKECKASIDQIMKDCKDKINTSDRKIKEIIFVGGSSRLPMFKQMIIKMFPNVKICDNINADECVAVGAAIKGWLMVEQKRVEPEEEEQEKKEVSLDDQERGEGEEKEETQQEEKENKTTTFMNEQIMRKMSLDDVTPLSIGVVTSAIMTTIVIPKNSPIPCEFTQLFTTVKDNQTSIKVTIVEGESAKAERNNQLYEFVFDSLPMKKRGEVSIELKMSLDEDGILTVTINDQSTQKNKTIKVHRNESNFLTEEQIDRMTKQAEEFYQEDQKWKLLQEGINEFEEHIHQKAESVPTSDDRLTIEQMEQLKNLCETNLLWLRENIKTATLEQVQSRRAEFDQQFVLPF